MRRVFAKRDRSDPKLSRSSRSSSSTSSSQNGSVASLAASNITEGAFSVGVSSDCNTKYRKTMEDVHKVAVPFLDSKDAGYFAVFDGHAGAQCAHLCGQHLHGLVASEIQTGQKIPQSLHKAFIVMDDSLKNYNIHNAGSTAGVAVVRWETPDGKTAAEGAPGAVRKLYVANVGDTRVILGRGGQALRLSYDHRGGDVYERKRIVNAGGIVMNNRVNGVLAVSRSLGDLYMKSFVLGAPYTTETVLQADDEFIIIACDGLWDVCSDSQAVKMVRNSGPSASAGSAALLKHALDSYSTDNITVMVVRLDGAGTRSSSTSSGNTAYSTAASAASTEVDAA